MLRGRDRIILTVWFYHFCCCLLWLYTYISDIFTKFWRKKINTQSSRRLHKRLSGRHALNFAFDYVNKVMYTMNIRFNSVFFCVGGIELVSVLRMSLCMTEREYLELEKAL